jgi:hypothetical protein
VVGLGVGDTVDLGVGLALTGFVDREGAPAAGGSGMGGGRLPHETSAAQATMTMARPRVGRAARI